MADFLTLTDVSKTFGDVRAVDEVSLEIRKGEIFSLLGPSGCGKTTTLRLIAGLEQPDAGGIALAGRRLADDGVFVPAQGRNMGMVFQSYAIWPHLTVGETVAYPLTVRKRAKAEIATRVRDVLKLVGLGGLEDRPTPMLSGGQQQRVALARALVYEPDVLLLDEPFSNLDVHLREQMRLEVKLLQRRIGVTVVLVTHDQQESLSLSDRIAVMNEGFVEQIGTPSELYETPQTPFVRDFIGAALKLPGKLVEAFRGEVQLAGGAHIFGRPQGVLEPGRDVLAVARPESIKVEDDGPIAAEIHAALYMGDHYDCVLRIDGAEVRVLLPRVPGAAPYHEGQKIRLAIPPEGVAIWPAR
jgi:ABC-type Fe3+/spermidine/putrescine transport system ATPase subunit